MDRESLNGWIVSYEWTIQPDSLDSLCPKDTTLAHQLANVKRIRKEEKDVSWAFTTKRLAHEHFSSSLSTVTFLRLRGYRLVIESWRERHYAQELLVMRRSLPPSIIHEPWDWWCTEGSTVMSFRLRHDWPFLYSLSLQRFTALFSLNPCLSGES